MYYLSPRKGTPSRCARKGTVVRRAHGVCKWRHFHRLLTRSIRTPSCTHSRHIRPKVIEFRNFECTNSYRAVGAVNHSIDNSERPCDCTVNDSHDGVSFSSVSACLGLPLRRKKQKKKKKLHLSIKSSIIYRSIRSVKKTVGATDEISQITDETTDTSGNSLPVVFYRFRCII